MESSDVSKLNLDIASPTPTETSYFWFIVLNLVFLGIFVVMLGFANVKEISDNWPKYRCNPAIMPFASLFGKDTAENFNYCTGNIFGSISGRITGPFATIFSAIIGIVMNLVKNINSLRIMFSSMLGGIVKIVREFKDRFRFVQNEVRRSVTRMQFLMGRVFSTMYAMIFMGTSAITAGMNFGDTFLFRFLDTFCFDPETLISLKKRGLVPIKHVKLGDILSNGEKVTSVYQFYSDGQPMMYFEGKDGPIYVSTNHYVQYNGKWIMAEKHPEAMPVDDWNGGTVKPLICLDTEHHTMPIGGYIFSDYDETSESDAATMAWAESTLNHQPATEKERPWLYQPCFHKEVCVWMRDGSLKMMGDLILGDELQMGKVCGIVERHVYDYVQHDKNIVTPSTLFWCNEDQCWKRAGHVAEVHHTTYPLTMRSIALLSSANIATQSGITYRDFVEVHSHDLEKETSAVLERRCTKVPVPEC